jgi:hypothetical protein
MAREGKALDAEPRCVEERIELPLRSRMGLAALNDRQQSQSRSSGFFAAFQSGALR